MSSYPEMEDLVSLVRQVDEFSSQAYNAPSPERYMYMTEARQLTNRVRSLEEMMIRVGWKQKNSREIRFIIQEKDILKKAIKAIADYLRLKSVQLSVSDMSSSLSVSWSSDPDMSSSVSRPSAPGMVNGHYGPPSSAFSGNGFTLLSSSTSSLSSPSEVYVPTALSSPSPAINPYNLRSTSK